MVSHYGAVNRYKLIKSGLPQPPPLASFALNLTPVAGISHRVKSAYQCREGKRKYREPHEKVNTQSSQDCSIGTPGSQQLN